jgi:hypothetical protein
MEVVSAQPKQNKTKQNKTKQNKTKQNKTKLINLGFRYKEGMRRRLFSRIPNLIQAFNIEDDESYRRNFR